MLFAEFAHLLILRIRQKVFGEEHPDYATSLNNIGMVNHKIGNYDKALEYLEKCLIIRQKVLGEEHPDYAATLNNIGIVYDSMRNLDKAL